MEVNDGQNELGTPLMQGATPGEDADDAADRYDGIGSTGANRISSHSLVKSIFDGSTRATSLAKSLQDEADVAAGANSSLESVSTLSSVALTIILFFNAGGEQCAVFYAVLSILYNNRLCT